MGTVTIKEPYEQNFYDYLEDTFRKYGFKTRLYRNFTEDVFYADLVLNVYEDKLLWRLRKPCARFTVKHNSQPYNCDLNGYANYALVRDVLIELAEGAVDITVNK